MSEHFHRLKWPTKAEVTAYLHLSILVFVVFVVIYGSCNWLASKSFRPYEWYLQWELYTPFIPQMVYIYLSISLLVALPLFVLRLNEFRPLAYTMLCATMIAGLFFLLLPAQLGFTWPRTVLGYEFIFDQIYRWFLPHNLAPSLHITYSSICVFVMVWRGSLALRAVLWLWLMLIYISVMVVHVHHLIDVITGMLLALVSYKAIFLRLMAKQYQPS